MKTILSLLIAILPGISIASVDDCLSKISQIVCEVEAPLKEKDRYQDGRNCLPVDTTKYQKQIISSYLLYPPFVQRQFCSIKKIYIERSFFGPAWSGAVDEKNPQEFLIGLRKLDLDQDIPLDTYTSWFEQQTFGGHPDFQLKPGLPTASISPVPTKPASFLVFTLLHEIAHLFDYQYGYNRAKEDSDFSNSWTNIHWKDIFEIRPEFDFNYRQHICLNNCRGNTLPLLTPT